MKVKDNLVLLTWTIKPSWNLKDYWWYTAVEFRLKSYFNTLIYYITNSNFKYIVFCENSCYDFNKYSKILLKLAELYNKEIEILQYEWNHQLSEKLWFWYWEWECIDYAFDNSKFFTKVDSFRKITWRYIYMNIDSIVIRSDNDDNLFFKNFSQVVWIFTWLFKVNKEVYKKYLYDIKKDINLSTRFEWLYYDKLNWKKIDFWRIHEIPNRVSSTIYDGKEINLRKIWIVWKFLFSIWQWNFSKKSIIYDNFIIGLMNMKHYIMH